MTKRLDRLLFFWVPVLALYLYAFNIILEVNAIKVFFNSLPLWGWLAGYLIIMTLTKIYLKSFSDQQESEENNDYTARTMQINSDIIIIFIFSVISFVLVMLLLGNSLSNAMNLMG
ncbi:MAG: hypothetical protein U9O20_04565 [Patescibacteria group bacterium]|nr:hypothetical protein [Patescibacteria group bacterium]